MEKLQLGQWEIELDRIVTSAAYQDMSFVNEHCDCDNCKNYFQAAECFPQVVLSFLTDFGIDVRKPAEIYGCEYKDGSLLYGGFYHLVGNYISGADAGSRFRRSDYFTRIWITFISLLLFLK